MAMVGLDGFRDLFQLKELYDSVMFLLETKWSQTTSKHLKALIRPTKLLLYTAYALELHHFQMFPSSGYCLSIVHLPFPLPSKHISSHMPGQIFLIFHPTIIACDGAIKGL